jgi:hypothetical protein
MKSVDSMMLQKIFSLIAGVSVLCAASGCSNPETQAAKPAPAAPPSPKAATAPLANEVAELQVLVETSLVYRSRMLRTSQRLKRNADGPIASSDLKYLKEGTLAYLGLRQKLYAIAEK